MENKETQASYLTLITNDKQNSYVLEIRHAIHVTLW